MAALTRRGWDTILTEVIRRSGGKNHSGWSARVQQFISAAYYDIFSLYRHKELETQDSFSVSSGSYYKNRPGIPASNHWIAFHEEEEPTKLLRILEYSDWASRFNATAGRPEFYALLGAGDSGDGTIRILFDRELDTDRNYVVVYQALPTRPDFTTTDTPKFGPQWDEHLIELSLAKIGAAIGDQQLASVNAALYKDFVSQVGQPLIQATTGAATPEASVSSKMSTGKLP